MRSEVGDEMFEQRKRADEAYKNITGKEPLRNQKERGSTSTSKPGRMQPARTVVKPAIITISLHNRILTDEKFGNLF